MLVPVPQAGAECLLSSNRRCFLTVVTFSIKRFVAVSLSVKTKTTGIFKLKKLQFVVALLGVLFNHIGHHPRGAALPLQPATDLIVSRILMKILVKM